MAGVLIQMKLALLRNSLTGSRTAWMLTGGVLGLGLAAATLTFAALGLRRPGLGVDLLGAVFAMWTAGWVVGPVWAGGEVALRPEHFSLLPVPRHRLAIGLLAAGCVGIGTLVTLIAFTGLVVYAVPLGIGPALIALPALVLQLLFVVLLSRVAAGALATVSASRIAAALAGVMLAAIMVLSQSGWVLIVAVRLSGVLSDGFPPVLALLIRALPSSWGLVAVDAAYRSQWGLAVLALAGLGALVLLLLAAWAWLLGAARGASAVARGSRRPRRSQPSRNRVVAVAIKELRTWWRDPARTAGFAIPTAWALMTCLLPLTLHSVTPYATVLLPWTAAGIALMAAPVTANLYAQDGTALWLTLLTPGAARLDVRGRQWAWLAVFGPVTILAALVLTGVSEMGWAWPWVAAMVPALLGGGAGLSVWASVVALAPGPDPRARRGSLMDRPTGGMTYLLFWLAPLPAVPALAVVLAGTLLHSSVLQWAGVPVGIGTGVAVGWWLGRVAHHRLEARGPELLQLMRSGRPAVTRRVETSQGRLETLPRRDGIIVLVCICLGAVALFPQGLVPLAIKLTGGTHRVWFLALYLPASWQWPVIGVMVALGLSAFGAVAYLLVTRVRRARGSVLQSSGDAAIP